MPLLSFPEGRNDEYLYMTGGRVMHPQSVRTILLGEEAVWQFQVVQETTTFLRVALVAADAADRRRIGERLAAATGGKFRVVVSLSQQSVGAASQRRR